MTDPIKIDDRTMAVERLRGAKAIGDFIGVSVDTVYDLASKPDVPIFKPPGSGRYCALKSELSRWMRTKAASC